MVAEDGRPSRGKRNPRSHSTRLLFINQTGPTFYKLTQVKEEEEEEEEDEDEDEWQLY